MNNDQSPHISVMAREVLEYLNVKPDGIYIDATLGMGGHTSTILKHAGADAKVVALDQDGESLKKAKEFLAPFSKQVFFVQRNFRKIDEALSECGIKNVDGIVFDLGISSFQLDNFNRGFSFQQSGPLDMRMDQAQGASAFDLIAKIPEKDLAKILFEYGDERYANRVARLIVSHRGHGAIDSTEKLAQVVLKAMPKGRAWQKIHPATRTFQALRIAVNDELGALKEALEKSLNLLKSGGRMCVISFHSLEDRIVKHQFKDWEKEKKVKVLTKKPLDPTEEEIGVNSRSRSAHMRVIERISA